MLAWSTLLLFVTASFHFRTNVDAQEPMYECYSWGDPHVQTWHRKGENGALYNQNCYTNGFYVFVRNEFIYYKVKVRSLLQIEVDLQFLDGTSKNPLCTFTSEDFEIGIDDNCVKHGITWNSTKTNTEFIININYPQAKFLTTVKQYLGCKTNCHYNIYVWHPQSLALRSKGICQRDDKECGRTIEEDSLESDIAKSNTPKLSISNEQARAICEKHVNTFLSKSRRAPHQRNTHTNNTIVNVLDGCIDDMMLTGQLEMARSGLDVLMIEELTNGMTSIESIQNSIQSGVSEALAVLDEAVEEAQNEVFQLLNLTTTTKLTTPTTTTTTTVKTTTIPVFPLASYKCAVYQDVYIQTWHPTNQASPPSRICSEISQNFELVRNKYVRYTLRTSGPVIDELTLILFDETSTKAICTVSAVGEDADWMNCEDNGINPILISTATHKTLTVYYAKANFTTIITRDIGINVGRFNINVYQNHELAALSTGICNLLSPCNPPDYAQSKKRFRREIGGMNSN